MKASGFCALLGCGQVGSLGALAGRDRGQSVYPLPACRVARPQLAAAGPVLTVLCVHGAGMLTAFLVAGPGDHTLADHLPP